MPHRGGGGAPRISPQCAGETSAHADAMKTAREAGEEQQRVVGHGRCSRTNRPRQRATGDGALFSSRQQSKPDEKPDGKGREAEKRNFLQRAGPGQRKSSL